MTVPQPPLQGHGDHPSGRPGGYGGGYRIVQHPARWTVATGTPFGEDTRYFRTQEEAHAENRSRGPGFAGRVVQVPPATYIVDNTKRIANADWLMPEYRM